MENKIILSDKFRNLIKIADEYKLDYLNAN